MFSNENEHCDNCKRGRASSQTNFISAFVRHRDVVGAHFKVSHNIFPNDNRIITGASPAPVIVIPGRPPYRAHCEKFRTDLRHHYFNVSAATSGAVLVPVTENDVHLVRAGEAKVNGVARNVVPRHDRHQ